jgi:hypothetical protein
LSACLERFGLILDPAQLRSIFTQFDTDGSGRLEYVEFVRLIDDRTPAPASLGATGTIKPQASSPMAASGTIKPPQQTAPVKPPTIAVPAPAKPTAVATPAVKPPAVVAAPAAKPPAVAAAAAAAKPPAAVGQLLLNGERKGLSIGTCDWGG